MLAICNIRYQFETHIYKHKQSEKNGELRYHVKRVSFENALFTISS